MIRRSGRRLSTAVWRGGDLNSPIWICNPGPVHRVHSVAPRRGHTVSRVPMETVPSAIFPLFCRTCRPNSNPFCLLSCVPISRASSNEFSCLLQAPAAERGRHRLVRALMKHLSFMLPTSFRLWLGKTFVRLDLFGARSNTASHRCACSTLQGLPLEDVEKMCLRAATARQNSLPLSPTHGRLCRRLEQAQVLLSHQSPHFLRATQVPGRHLSAIRALSLLRSVDR